MSADAVSARGRRLTDEPPMPEYLYEHFECRTDAWDDIANPDGYVGLCIAENMLVWDLLEPRLRTARQVPSTAVAYDEMLGNRLLRDRLAAFLGRTLYGREFAAEQVAVLGGAGSVLELLFYALADPGEAVLVPTPSYAGFWADLETRDELTIVPVHTTSDDGFALHVEQLEEAYRTTQRPVRALLFTSPSNPLGRVYGREQIEEVLAWAEARELHVVFDELFALSVFGDTPFVSGATLRPALGERTHLVWAVSKDLAMSGLRCGVLVSENAAVMQAVDGLAYWAGVSGDTQHLLAEMVADSAWIDGFVTENERRLGDAYGRVTGALEEYGIPYVPAEAGFFFLVDVRPFLAEITWGAEHALWRRMVEEARVNLTPGAACRVGEPGFMRLVFAGVPPTAAEAAVRRLGRMLTTG